MKIITFILILVFYSEVYSQSTRYASSVNHCANLIKISGETNVNDFELEQEVTEGKVRASGKSAWLKGPGDHLYEMQIPVHLFNANNNFVYKDFLHLIKASEYPFIHITVDEKEFMRFYGNENILQSEITISLAGVSKSYKIRLIISECIYGERTVKGIKKLRLTDFKLEPPVKSLGLIKVKNELNVNFEFIIPDHKVSAN